MFQSGDSDSGAVTLMRSLYLEPLVDDVDVHEPYARHWLDGGGRCHSHRNAVRAAYTGQREDHDWEQARALVGDVLGEPARGGPVDGTFGYLLDGASQAVLDRAFRYWRTIAGDLGGRIEVRAGASGH